MATKAICIEILYGIGFLVNQSLAKPMSIASNQSLNVFFSEDARGPMCNPLIQALMEYRFELFNYNFDGEIVIAIKHMSGVALVNLERPFAKVQNLVS